MKFNVALITLCVAMHLTTRSSEPDEYETSDVAVNIGPKFSSDLQHFVQSLITGLILSLTVIFIN
jgi:hypothetical protein